MEANQHYYQTELCPYKQQQLGWKRQILWRATGSAGGNTKTWHEAKFFKDKEMSVHEEREHTELCFSVCAFLCISVC